MYKKRVPMPGAVAAVMGVGTAVLGLVLGLAVQGEGHAGAVKSAEKPRHQPSAGPSKSAGPKPAGRSISHATEGGDQSVALTVDDGPHPVWTPKVLDLLDQYGVKATFCLIGPNAEAHPELVRRIVAEGHRLCDHSVNHDTGMDQGETAKDRKYRESEIGKAKRMIDKASGGAPVRYYRAPGGAFTPDSRHYAAAHGMRPLGWTADSDDWRLPGVPAIVSTVQREVTAGARIILMHDGGGDRSQSYQALQQLLPWLQQQGYDFSFPRA